MPAFEKRLSRPSEPPPGPPTMIPGESVSKPGGRIGCDLAFAHCRSSSWSATTTLSIFSIALTPPPDFPPGVQREVARRGVRLLALDFDPEVHEPALCSAQPELARLERDRHIACGRALDDLTGAIPDHLLVTDDVEHDVPARQKPLLERHLDRPHCRREAPLHVRRAPPVEPSVDDRAAERLLRPRAPIADGNDVHVRVERERAAASRARQPGDDERMRRERRRRADVPAVELEPERGEEVADVADAAARLVGEVRRLLRLALGAEGDQVAKQALELCLRPLRRPRRLPRVRPFSTTRLGSTPPRTRRGRRRDGGCGRPRRTRARATRRSGA